MSSTFAFSQRALETLIADEQHREWLTGTLHPSELASPYLLQTSGHANILRRAGEESETRLVILTRTMVGDLLALAAPHLQTALERSRTAFNNLKSPPWHLPLEWAEYHTESRLAFFALPKSQNPDSLRALAEALHGEWEGCLIYWTITSRGNEHQLSEFIAKTEDNEDLAALLNARSLRATPVGRRRTPGPTDLLATVRLTEITPANQNAWQTYSWWLSSGLLSDGQRNFLNSSLDKPYTITGVAGSGKSLLLMLKAIQYAQQNITARVGFITHSWHLADRIDSAIRHLDDAGVAERIEVLPFFAIAQQHVGPDLARNDIRIIGEDSLSGKLGFYDIVSSTISEHAPPLLKSLQVSSHLGARISAPDPAVRNGLAWDITIEFATVFLANNIVPTPNNRRKYLELDRLSWMMPLHSLADRELVYRLFEQFQRLLRSRHEATSGHLSALFNEYLSGFVWDYVRPQQGYDAIFADEYHFFDAVERSCLGSLTRDASAAYPRIVRAMDQRQGPLAIFHDTPMRGVTTDTVQPRSTAEETIALSEAYRFTPPILAFVKHVLNAFPMSDLEQQDTSVARADDNEIAPAPAVSFADDGNQVAVATTNEVARIQASSSNGERVAVISVSGEDVSALSTTLKNEGVRILEVSTRDRLDRLSYDSRSVPVVSARDVAGLQFDNVVVVLQDDELYRGLEDYRRRRLLSLFYVAITRARRRLSVVVGDAPVLEQPVAMLRKAVDLGIAEGRPVG